jgi:hypothetical protein
VNKWLPELGIKCRFALAIGFGGKQPFCPRKIHYRPILGCESRTRLNDIIYFPWPDPLTTYQRRMGTKGYGRAGLPAADLPTEAGRAVARDNQECYGCVTTSATHQSQFIFSWTYHISHGHPIYHTYITASRILRTPQHAVPGFSLTHNGGFPYTPAHLEQVLITYHLGENAAPGKARSCR